MSLEFQLDTKNRAVISTVEKLPGDKNRESAGPKAKGA